MTPEGEPPLVADNIPVGIALMAPNGELEVVNRQMCEYFGKTLEELRTWGASNEVHPDDLPHVLAKVTHSLSTGDPYDVEERLRRFDGVYRWFQVRGLPQRDAAGRIVRWYIVHTDIDDRKRAEDALRARERVLERSETLLTAGQQLSSTGTFYWRMDSDELEFSTELYRIFEFEAGTLVTPGRVADRLHPDDRAMLCKGESEAPDPNELSDGWYPATTPDLRVIMADGRMKYIQSKVRIVRAPDGRLESVGAIQDVTQRRLAEEALDKNRSELTHAARAMSLGVLTASIAHELNQPLAGIITNASTCSRMLRANPPNVDGALETARRSIRDGHRAAEVITRLRALFGNKELASEAVDLNQALREVVALCSHELRRRDIALQMELDEALRPVRGDRVQLQQVILNLVLNACDALKSVDDRARELVIRTAHDEKGSARLTVRDNGTGVTSETLDRLFDSFFTTKPDGMGIGLSVSRAIIERHRGRLWASQNEGAGTAFSFAIPVDDSSTEPSV